jgi:hypothetical protein
MKKVFVLGSTGWIGTQALEIVAASEELSGLPWRMKRLPSEPVAFVY